MRRKISIFDTLGVRPEDDFDTIRTAFRTKVKELHPDVAANKEQSGILLAQINAAYGDLKGHTPFQDRRRGSRRAAKRAGGWWSTQERKAARARAERDAFEQAARRKADAEARARRQAEAEQRRQAAERAAEAARQAELRQERDRRAAAQRAARIQNMSIQERAAVRAAVAGYGAARAAISV